MSNDVSSSFRDTRKPRNALTARVINTICLPRRDHRDEPNCMVNPTIKRTIMIGQTTNTGKTRGTFWSRRQRTTAIDVIGFAVVQELRTRSSPLFPVSRAIQDPTLMSVQRPIPLLGEVERRQTLIGSLRSGS